MHSESPPNAHRRLLLRLTSIIGGISAALSAYPFLASFMPSTRARAAGAPVEIDIAGLEEGALATVEWRGKPVWVVRRTKAMLSRLDKNEERLSDPESRVPQQPDYCRNATRSIKPEFFVAVGICTHLGCSPIFRPEVAPADLGAGWPGGFYCPCHGSKFDLAGRVFSGVPAPTNLEVPAHAYIAATRILVGEDRLG